jgi:Domain of unknown function (DU1801)
MAKAQAKTKPTAQPVSAWLASIKDATRREDCETLLKLMEKATGDKPRMWGSMVGFGDFHYKYESGHEGDTFKIGFASRKPDFVLYLMCGLEKNPALLAKLGKHRLGKSCLYVRRLSDVDTAVLAKLVDMAARDAQAKSA